MNGRRCVSLIQCGNAACAGEKPHCRYLVRSPESVNR